VFLVVNFYQKVSRRRQKAHNRHDRNKEQKELNHKSANFEFRISQDEKNENN